MKFFTPSDLTTKALSSRIIRSRNESADVILAKEASNFSNSTNYDIFLSHSFLDADLIYGLKQSLEASDFSVYVYWIEDASDQSKVSPETADRIRARMRSCNSLLYATSENAESSKWMPWELGYFDGLRGKVAVCPITNSSSFQGREYLGLYPIMEKDLWLHKNGTLYKMLSAWISGA